MCNPLLVFPVGRSENKNSYEFLYIPLPRVLDCMPKFNCLAPLTKNVGFGKKVPGGILSLSKISPGWVFHKNGHNSLKNG